MYVTKKKKFYRMDALSSITAYELAQILQSMEISISDEIYDNLKKDIKRHFREEREEENVDGSRASEC